ncbi:hypothetical protein BDV95DRAFT_627456 [Massariosphaeria phaeospora]|uniref:Uncharacterized protein n=1 Tax=Massariosphaeria phaeospora TaxID=100035 RepID=A0A7C8MNJ2_9PLEO|nr:hypothetical protein BDV95DRAFT_627456 [Massariosphaeria phaeospora]
MPRFSQILSLFSLATLGLAGTPIPSTIPFLVDGGLEASGCTVDNPSEYNSGGFIKVNGFNIKVPKNMIVQFPVAWVPFPQLCGAKASGYEIVVAGNVIDGQAIAGQIQLSARFGLEGSQGYIEQVNFDGTLKIRGGPTVRINDLNGTFSAKLDNSPHPLFLADGSSPSITAFSGFPMCIPRSSTDEKCPASNRPTGATNFAPQDPLKMVPFRVGDFIEYSGVLDGDNILAWSIVAINVQATTVASDTVPNYIRVEDMLVGIPDNAPNVEVADIRVIGFLSSCPGATVSISAIEVDPCTGEETYRQIGTATPRQEERCKFEARLDTVGRAPYTREYLVKVNTPVIETADGIQAGQIVQAVGEWIFPEVDLPGTEPPPLLFTDIRGIAQGDFLDGQRFGRLSPFPGPAPSGAGPDCSNIPNEPVTSDPVAAIASISAVQIGGAQIRLLGSNTVQGIPSDDLVYNWTYTKSSSSAPAVSIVNAAQPTATFTAPKVTAETPLTFELKISRKSNTTSTSKATITVRVSPTADDVVTLDTYSWESRQSGTISVTCHSNVVNGDNKGMTLLLNNGARRLAMTSSGGGRWSYSSRSVAQPTNVQCLSDLRGKSALVTAPTAARRKRRGELGLGNELMSRAEPM